MMQKSSFMRVYVLLRAVHGGGSGFARIESQLGRGRITIHASQMPSGCGVLRALLLAGDVSSGSLMDLGLMKLGGRGCGTLRRDNLTFPSLDGLHGYHSLMLATDWPNPVLVLYGALTDPPACPLWQLQEALQHYLSVPSAEQGDASAVTDSPDVVGDSVEVATAEVESPRPTLPCENAPSSAEPTHEPICLVPPSPSREDTSRPVLTVHCLPPLIWPEAIAELKIYFDTLPPFAPFDAPGWRFVRVPLPGQNPAPYCAVGIRVRNRSITEVAYAIPGQPGTLPPGGLRGYRWQAGRNGQGYWTLWQGVRSA